MILVPVNSCPRNSKREGKVKPSYEIRLRTTRLKESKKLHCPRYVSMFTYPANIRVPEPSKETVNVFTTRLRLTSPWVPASITVLRGVPLLSLNVTNWTENWKQSSVKQTLWLTMWNRKWNTANLTENRSLHKTLSEESPQSCPKRGVKYNPNWPISWFLSFVWMPLLRRVRILEKFKVKSLGFST